MSAQDKYSLQERGRFKAWWDAARPLDGSAFPYEIAWAAWQAALSAQPSPGGQGDALLDQARKLFDELGAIADDDKCVAILAAALAARQPVGEPIGWYTEDHLTDRSATTYDRTVADRWRAKGWPVYPLYGAPLVLFKELQKLRELQALIGGKDGAHG